MLTRIMFGEIRGVTSMSQARREMRVPVDLELRVWGMGAEGRVFSQHARIRNVSIGGALLSASWHGPTESRTIGHRFCTKRRELFFASRPDDDPVRAHRSARTGPRLKDGRNRQATSSRLSRHSK